MPRRTVRTAMTMMQAANRAVEVLCREKYDGRDAVFPEAGPANPGSPLGSGVRAAPIPFGIVADREHVSNGYIPSIPCAPAAGRHPAQDPGDSAAGFQAWFD